jgi:hypothetical protein
MSATERSPLCVLCHEDKRPSEHPGFLAVLEVPGIGSITGVVVHPSCVRRHPSFVPLEEVAP